MFQAVVFLLPVLFSVAAVETPTLTHQPVDCIVAGKFAVIPACFEPVRQMARGRVYFQVEDSTSWFYVDVKSAEAACWSGVLPKPSKALLNRHVRYYVEVMTPSMEATRTKDHDALVVRSAEECEAKVVAAVSSAGPAAVLPFLPGGFSVGGLSVPLIVAGAGGALGTVAVVARPGGAAAPTPAPAPAPGPIGAPSPSPTPAPSATPAPTATPNPSASPSPTPSPMPSPTPSPTPSPSPSPTPSPSPSPTPSPSPSPTPAPTRFRLTVTKRPLGLVLGSVTSAPGGINCGLLCATASATFPSGTVVTLSARPTLTARFDSWGGDCSGSGGCSVTMDGDRSVTADFSLLGLVAPTADARPEVGAPTLRSTLGVRGGRGDVALNGSSVLAAREGEGWAALQPRPGENVVEARLLEGAGGGLWQFDLAGTRLQGRALRVVAGELAAVAPDSVTFRLSGRPGERVSFAWTSVRGE